MNDISLNCDKMLDQINDEYRKLNEHLEAVLHGNTELTEPPDKKIKETLDKVDGIIKDYEKKSYE